MDTIRNNIYILKFYLKYKDGKKLLFYKLLNSFSDVLCPLFLTYSSGQLINELIYNNEFKKIICWACIVIFLPFFQRMFSKIMDLCISKKTDSIETTVYSDFLYRYMNIEYSLLEQPEIQVKKVRASMSLLSNINIIDRIVGMISSIVTLIAVLVMIETIDILVLFFILVTTIIGYFIKKCSEKSILDLNKKKSKQDMILSVYQGVIDNWDSAKEIRFFNLSHFLKKVYTEKKRAINEMNEKKRVKAIGAFCFDQVVLVVRNVLVYVFAILRILNGSIDVGKMTILVSYTSRFAGVLSGVVSNVLYLKNNSKLISELKDFFNLPMISEASEYDEMNVADEYNIEFRNVSFKYPGNDSYALENISIKISPGEKIAIVGENGAGKTTFVKLLLGLYKPCSGEIVVNGVNLNKLNIMNFQKNISAVFQDYILFPLSIRQNILLDDDTETSLDSIYEQCCITNFVLNAPMGENTYIGKEIYSNGINPSGGEGQRIAIARALNRGGNFYILDEPTAALDPNAEYEVYTQFHNMIKDKTAILVTHRLSAVQLADKVAVFDKGHIVEYGTHNDLYSLGGKYKEMFDKQSEFYVKATS